MKTRIIYGTALGAALILLLIAGSFFPLIYNVVGAAVAAFAVYEVLNSTGFCKNAILMYIGMAYALLSPFTGKGLIPIGLGLLTIVYILVQIIVTLIFNKTTSVNNMLSAILFPILIGYSLRSLVFIMAKQYDGLFYFLLIICFTVFADIGAYFVGVFFGKHKMAPNISPNKTYEGLIGGFAISLLVTLGLCLFFKFILKHYYVRIWYIMVLAPLFIALGVIGDLLASYLKRQSNIKDFGSIIPGHGGIMDRLDSFLLVSPAFFIIDGILLISGNW